jgi:hypothetical protein
LSLLLHRLALLLALLMPWLLLHTQAGSEASIDVVAICFLLHSAIQRRWAWVAEVWVKLGLAWWGWQVICTLIHVTDSGWASVVQSVGVLRFLIFAAALESWALSDPRDRVWFLRSLSLAALYLVAQTLTQFATGHNWYGAPPSVDGELTGPFEKPRDGPTYIRMIFPVLVPAAATLIGAKHWGKRLGGFVLLAVALAVSVLIGQRMPLLLAIFGLVVMGLLLPRLRGGVLVALVAGAGLLAASVMVAPAAFYRLVTKFSRQMADFPDSPYGLIAGRSVAIAEQHPLTGRGYDGFRTGCALPRYFQGWHWPGTLATTGDGGGAALCVTHPHNFYLQAVTDSGVPGLLLFCALVGAWLYLLGERLHRQPDPLRVGLFVAGLIQLWPIASTSPMISLPIGGWFFLLLGVGLAVRNQMSA